MTVPIGQGYPQVASPAGPPKGGAAAKGSGSGFSDLLQGADQRPAQRNDDAGADSAVSGDGQETRKTAGLSPFGAFHPQSGRQAVTGDKSEPASTDDEGKDGDGKDQKRLPDQASVIATIGYAVRHDQPSAQAGDQGTGSRSAERGRTDRFGKATGAVTSADAEEAATAGDLSKAREAPSMPSAIDGRATAARSAASPMPAAMGGMDRNDATSMPDDVPDHAEATARLPKPSHALRGMAGRPDRGDADGRDAPHAGKDTGQQANVVHVVSERSFPAPAAPSIGSTVANLAEVLAAARSQAATPAALAQQHPTVAVPAHTLRIELHPAELGTVMASLKLSGDQLSVELKPDTAEAYRHLSKESDAIASSLKKLGLDVGTVTVMQPSLALTAAARTDAGNQASVMPGRDGAQFQQGTSGGGGSDSGGRQSGGNRGHDGQTLDPAKPVHRGRAGGSVFI